MGAGDLPKERLQALVSQWTVLRKTPGVSPVVKTFLRQAGQRLKDTVAAPDRRDLVVKATTDLQSCMKLIQEGATVEADKQLLDGLASSLSALFGILKPKVTKTLPLDPPPAAVARPAAFPAPLVVPPPSASPPVPSPIVARAFTATPADDTAFTLHVARLERQYRARAVCIEAPGATLGDLAAVESRIRKREAAASALGAIGAKLCPEDPPEGCSSPLHELMALRLLGSLETTTPELERTLFEMAALPAGEQRLAMDILRLIPSHVRVADLSHLMAPSVSVDCRAALLPLLLERGLVDGAALLALLAEPTPLALVSAEALAWHRVPNGGRLLLERAFYQPPGPLSEALLFASVMQGDRGGLSEARIRSTGAEPSSWIVDALAVAGDADDLALLVEMAVRGGQVGRYALLATACLGSAGVVHVVERLEQVHGPVLVAHAIDLLTAGREISSPTGARFIHGQRWSPQAVVERLSAPEELPRALLRWMTLDLAARTGIAPPCMYDPASSAERQRAVLQRFGATYRQVVLGPPGNWYYSRRVVGTPN